MIRILMGLAFLLVLGTPAGAGPCSAYAPYYTYRVETGPGALLADILLFTMSMPVVVGTVGGRRATVCDRMTGECRRVSTAACLPITVAQHFGQNRPPHVEHWQAYD